MGAGNWRSRAVSGHRRARQGAVRWTMFGATPPATHIGLCVADMDLASPPFVRSALRGTLRQSTLGYTVARASLREAVAEWYARRHGWSISPEYVLILPFGAKTAVRMLVEHLADLSRPVLLPTPVYSGLRKVLASTPARLVEWQLPTDARLRYELNVDELAACARQADAGTLVLCSPHNPVGRVWSGAELAAVAEMAARLDLLVISDEVHSDLVHPGWRHVPWGAAAEHDRWAVVHSVGKAFNLSGVPLSLAMLPTGPARAKLRRAISDWGFHEGSLLGDVAAEAALRHGDAWLDARVQAIQASLRFARDRLVSAHRPLPCTDPAAGFLLWIDVRGMAGTAGDAADQIYRETGVRLLGGARFGKGGEGFVRMNVATSPRALRSALDRLAAFVERSALSPA